VDLGEVKRISFHRWPGIQAWTTMVCHVYDATYCKVMTIVAMMLACEPKDVSLRAMSGNV
jgi:hypothetical protein